MVEAYDVHQEPRNTYRVDQKNDVRDSTVTAKLRALPRNDPVMFMQAVERVIEDERQKMIRLEREAAEAEAREAAEATARAEIEERRRTLQELVIDLEEQQAQQVIPIEEDSDSDGQLWKPDLKQQLQRNRGRGRGRGRGAGALKNEPRVKGEKRTSPRDQADDRIEQLKQAVFLLLSFVHGPAHTSSRSPLSESLAASLRNPSGVRTRSPSRVPTESLRTCFLQRFTVSPESPSEVPPESLRSLLTRSH